MKNLKLTESTIGADYELRIAEMTSGHITFPGKYIDIMSQLLLLAMADYAKKLRNKETPIAVAIDDEAGKILFWVKLEFMTGTEDDPDGSWNPSWGFTAEELGEGVTIYRTSNNNDLAQFTITRAASYRISFPEPIQISNAYRCFALTLTNWLDINASAEEEVVVTEPDFWTAQVKVIDDVKVFTFSSSEELTNIMKGDASLQVNP